MTTRRPLALTALGVLLAGLTAAGGPPDQESKSDRDDRKVARKDDRKEDKAKMTIEGKVTRVMEVYPPRLVVRTEKGEEYTVSLAEDKTKVLDGKRPLEGDARFGKFRADQAVRVVIDRAVASVVKTQGRMEVNAVEVEIKPAR